jgi:hypothetical protein
MAAEWDDRFEPNWGMVQRYSRANGVRDEWEWVTTSPHVLYVVDVL